MLADGYDVNLGPAAREIRSHGTREFPVAAYRTVYGPGLADAVPWHWHEEFEIVTMESGRMRYAVPSGSYDVGPGDYLVVNANVLHHGSTQEGCVLQSLVFSKLLIEGREGSAVARKYVEPLLACASFSGYLIPAEDASIVRRWFNDAFLSMADEMPGYEFAVRGALSRIVQVLFAHFEPELELAAGPLDRSDVRMKRMLSYIQDHYAEPIGLADIARAADVGPRECQRCFKESIQLSPIQYLLRYRTMRGAIMLTRAPMMGIAEIAGAVGFDSPSNFSMLFKRFYGRTPRAYRSAAGYTGST